MFTPPKTKEKPSIVSKKVLNTHRKNGTELFRLTEKIKTLEHKQSQKNIDIDIEMNSLKKRMETVQRVKEKIALSTERRLLLKSQGFTINVTKGGEENDILLRRQSLQLEAGNWATLLTKLPNLARHEPLTLDEESLDSIDHDSLSSKEIKVRERTRSCSIPNIADLRPTPVSRYRVIEPPLRPGSRRGFALSSTILTPKNEHENLYDTNSKPSSRCGSAAARTQQNSPRSLFVDAVIAARDNQLLETLQSNKPSDNWKKAYFKASRRTKSAPMRAGQRRIESQEHRYNAQETKCRDVLKTDDSFKEAFQATAGLELASPQGERHDTTSKEFEERNQTSQKEFIESDEYKDLRSLKIDECQVMNPPDKESFNLEITDCFIDETAVKETEKRYEHLHVVNDSAKFANQFDNCQSNEMKTSENDDNVDHLRSHLTSQSAIIMDDNELNVSPSTLNEETKQTMMKKNDCMWPSFAQSKASCTDTNTRAHHPLPGTCMSSRMATGRRSSYSESVNKPRCHGNPGSRKSIIDSKGESSNLNENLLNRRLSHPPRLTLKKKGPKNDEEVVYAYDARPDKSLSKGYTAMQMTVGGRQVKLSMASFPKESGNMAASRAKANAKLKTFKTKT